MHLCAYTCLRRIFDMDGLGVKSMIWGMAFDTLITVKG